MNSELRRDIQQIYEMLDQQARRFRVASGIRCPRRCGICCKSVRVEATAIECIPLAYEIFRRGKEETVSLAIELKQSEGDLRCVLYHPEPENSDWGRCAYYRFRPLVCRLFGFAARRGKHGRTELCLCGVARELSPTTLPSDDLPGMDPPIYQDSFLRVLSLNPDMGRRLIPINTALKEALEYLYWKVPEGTKGRRKAA
jgi:Fe-S-cluster containining protein